MGNLLTIKHHGTHTGITNHIAPRRSNMGTQQHRQHLPVLLDHQVRSNKQFRSKQFPLTISVEYEAPDSQTESHGQFESSGQPTPHTQPALPTQRRSGCRLPICRRPETGNHPQNTRHPTPPVASPGKFQTDPAEEEEEEEEEEAGEEEEVPHEHSKYRRTAAQSTNLTSTGPRTKTVLRRQYGESKFPFLLPPFNPGVLFCKDKYAIDRYEPATDDAGRPKRRVPAISFSRLSYLDRDEKLRSCNFVYGTKKACPYPTNNECAANHNVTRDQLL